MIDLGSAAGEATTTGTTGTTSDLSHPHPTPTTATPTTPANIPAKPRAVPAESRSCSAHPSPSPPTPTWTLSYSITSSCPTPSLPPDLPPESASEFEFESEPESESELSSLNSNSLKLKLKLKLKPEPEPEPKPKPQPKSLSPSLPSQPIQPLRPLPAECLLFGSPARPASSFGPHLPSSSLAPTPFPPLSSSPSPSPSPFSSSPSPSPSPHLPKAPVDKSPPVSCPAIRRRSPTVHTNHPGSAVRPLTMPYHPPYPLLPSDGFSSSTPRSLPEKPTSAPFPIMLRSSFPLSIDDALISPPRKRRTWIDYSLFLLLLIVLGTVTVLTTVNVYFGVYPADVILPTELEVDHPGPSRVPKIIHQTWKTTEIPDRWVPVRSSCAATHPGWEYMMWTDESGRQLIEREYPWFLDTYDGYRYPIQRADAVRYFILHHYGGVYMDLDIGCLRPMDSLLRFDLVLPQTIPVGVSNDLMFSAKGHPFMDFIIHRLAQFDHDYQLNYATVMFSTGPMAVSALLSQFRRSPLLSSSMAMAAFGPVRILPPKLYGKNLAMPQPSPGPFFTHYYGSSWHTDGAGPVLWLGKFGMFWLYTAIALVVGCGLRGLVMSVAKRTSLGEAPTRHSKPAAHGIGSPKTRGSGVALWKRRLRRGRHTEARIADVLLLPGHWLDKAAAAAATQKSLRGSRTHRNKGCMQCKSCKLAEEQAGGCENGLPPYESPALHSTLPSERRTGRRAQRVEPTLSDDEWDEAEEEVIGPGGATHFFTSPTPIVVPATPHLYRSCPSSNGGHTMTRLGSNTEELGNLPSPLLNAIYRLAELAGIVGDSSDVEEAVGLSSVRTDDTSPATLERPSVLLKVD